MDAVNRRISMKMMVSPLRDSEVPNALITSAPDRDC